MTDNAPQDLDLLVAAFDTTAAVLAGIGSDQRGRSTPCTDYDVGALENHVVGWLQMFEAWANGRTWDGDAEAYVADDAASESRSLADSSLEGWRSLGTDREIEGMGSTLPADFVLSMMITEYVVHGWDLASATDQTTTLDDAYSEALLERVLARGQAMLQPQYRGPGKMFGDEVAVPDDAPALNRLVAFFGRTP